MPTDNVLNRNFLDLFTGQVRFEIPFFQRGYAWEQRQWKKLFEDIETEVFESVQGGNFDDAEHFFGPIVVLEKIASHPSLKRFLIIDGQQRITTVYLLLSVIKRAFEAKAHLATEASKYAHDISLLLENNIIASTDEYLHLKVFSTKGDRYPTFKAVFDKNPTTPSFVEDQILYNPDDNKIDEFIKFANKRVRTYDVPQLYQLYQAIVRSLKIVWIPLNEAKDDAQAIFESLNDAGMPLSASELLCNFIFKPIADDTNNDHEKLHNEKWLKARRNIGNDKFEDYLRNLFSIGERKRVGRDRRMYVHFKVKNRKLSITTARGVLERILDYTNVYNFIDNPLKHHHPNVKIKNILIAINNTNMSSINPFLMALLKSYENSTISLEDTLDLLHEVYVLLVRRKITTLPVTKYDTFFPPLFDIVITEPDKVKAFQSQVQKEGLWVSDQAFESAFLEKEIYNSRELNFSRLVLQEIDKKLQKHGELPDYSTLNTIEHIIPQTLDDHWKAYLVNDAKDINLPLLINTIGNLSLNSRIANSSNGQDPFIVKQGNYNKISSLAKDIIENRIEPWNLLAVKTRSQDLAKIALEVWKWKLN